MIIIIVLLVIMIIVIIITIISIVISNDDDGDDADVDGVIQCKATLVYRDILDIFIRVFMQTP